MIIIKVVQDTIGNFDDPYANQLYNVDATFNISEDSDGTSVMKAVAAAMRLETYDESTIANCMKDYGDYLMGD